MHGLVDRLVFERTLQVGERSALFESGSHIQREYGPHHRICYFYVRLPEEVGRVELPAWVAEQPGWLDLIHAVVVDQAEKGGGYPIILTEAHERAVIRAQEKALFYRILEREMQRAGLRGYAGSQKAASKRAPTNLSMNPIAEVIESSTRHFVAEVLRDAEAPDFGAWAEVVLEDGTSLFAVVAHVETGSVEPGRRAMALGMDRATLRREMPQVMELIRTTFRAQVLAYRDARGTMHQTLPPRPAALHDMVRPLQRRHRLRARHRRSTTSARSSATPRWACPPTTSSSRSCAGRTRPTARARKARARSSAPAAPSAACSTTTTSGSSRSSAA